MKTIIQKRKITRGDTTNKCFDNHNNITEIILNTNSSPQDYMFEEEFAVAKQLQPPAQTSFIYNPPHTERHPAWTGFLRMRMTRGEYTGNMRDNLHTPKVDTSQVSPIFMCDFRRAVPQKTNLCNFCNQPAQHSKVCHVFNECISKAKRLF